MHSEYMWSNDKPWLLSDDMIFYENNGIDISTFKSMDEHYLRMKYPNGEEIKYPIQKEHYLIEEYEKFRYMIFSDARLKMRQLKLDSINKKLKQ